MNGKESFIPSVPVITALESGNRINGNARKLEPFLANYPASS
jgi:hypothetical protein